MQYLEYILSFEVALMRVVTVAEREISLAAVMRPSMVCNAPVSIGGYSRGGMRRRDSQAADHDMRCEEQHTPFGVINEDSS
jgi:hypothetical protein